MSWLFLWVYFYLSFTTLLTLDLVTLPPDIGRAFGRNKNGENVGKILIFLKYSYFKATSVILNEILSVFLWAVAMLLCAPGKGPLHTSVGFF